MRTVAPALILALALAGCAQSRRCREARAEARWAAHAYLESARLAVRALDAEREALEAALEGDDAVAVDAEDPAEALVRHEEALVAWRARLAGVQEAHATLQGGGPIAGEPLAAFAPRNDEANPTGAEAARRAVQQALDVCGRAR